MDYPNRVAELRRKAGIKSQTELARRLGWSQQKVSSIERGRSRLTVADARALGAELGVAPADLTEPHSRSVPVELAVASFESPERPESGELPSPHELIQAPRRLSAPEDCFVADVLDHSADRLYPPGSTLFVRRLPAEGAHLEKGAEVVVRRFSGTRKEGRTLDVLVGYLDRTVTGDLVVVIPTDDRRLQGSVVVQRPTNHYRALGERTRIYLAREDTIDYQPRDDDPAEILGEIVYATTPRARASA